MPAPRSLVSKLSNGLQGRHIAKASKFDNRSQTRAPHPSVKYVQPVDRVRRWNIRPGDKVRVMVGKPEEKYKNESDGREGWKVHVVKQVDVSRNWVYVDGITNKKTNAIRPKPSNYDQLSDTEKQTYDNQRNSTTTMRPVHYSNVQLCLKHDEKGSESIFASRIKTTEPKWNPIGHRMEWNRLAARLTGTAEVEAQTEAVRIPWALPEKKREIPEAKPHMDTPNDEVRARTVRTPKIEQYGTAGEVFWSQHINSPPPADNTFSDYYIESKGLREDHVALLDNIMPLYLSEELSPRFAKTKMWKAWRTRREAADLEKLRAGQEAVNAWNKAGRDTGLEIALEHVVLDDVHLRKRTAGEVRAAAEVRYESENAKAKREVAQQTRAGRKYNLETGKWEDGPETVKADRKRSRKERKARRAVQRLAALKLEEGINMVVPKAVRVEAGEAAGEAAQ